MGLVAAFGDDEGHRLTPIAYSAPGQHLLAVVLVLRPFFHLGEGEGWDIAQRADIRAGIDRQHARHGARGRCIDAGHIGMGIGAAQHIRVGQALRHQVINELTLAHQQSWIFKAKHWLRDAELRHALSPGEAVAHSTMRRA